MSTKELTKAWKAIENTDFQTRLLQAPPSQIPEMLRMKAVNDWVNMSFFEKVGLCSKAICKSCIEKLNPKNWKK